MQKISQSQRILKYLQTGRKLTPIQALNKFGCMRLGARIHDLKKLGYNIISEFYKPKKGVHVKRYWLGEQDD